jgi:hypothetical protein
MEFRNVESWKGFLSFCVGGIRRRISGADLTSTISSRCALLIDIRVENLIISEPFAIVVKEIHKLCRSNHQILIGSVKRTVRITTSTINTLNDVDFRGQN